MMTAFRFQQLKAGAPTTGAEEQAEFERQLAQELRSQAAFRAVATKRRRYKKWPTRRGDHK